MPLVVIIGLGAALIFGAADFLGGLAAKRMNAVLVTAMVAAVGLAALLLVLPFFGGVWSWQAVIFGGLSGVAGAIAIVLLYASLAIGPMSILSPLTAVVSAIVPLTVGLATGDQLGPLGYLALGIALVAVVLVGFVPEKGAVRPSLKGLLMATGSGIAIGAFLILIDATPDDSGLVPLVANRAANSTLMFAIVGVLALLALRRGRERTPSASLRTGLLLATAGGVIDAVANMLLLLGVRLGELSVIAVLSALYPAGTIILAAIVLRERIAPVQYVGLVLAIGAAAMLAVA